jgi:hypothetical protein
MPSIEDIFIPHNARSAAFRAHKPGEIAFITNGLKRNGVVGFVRPMPQDRVFQFMGIVVSTFCEATVQLPPFIARGNGGSGLIVLEPRTSMSVGQLGYLAGYINTALRWRYSWYRQATAERIRRVILPSPKDSPQFKVREILPDVSKVSRLDWRFNFQPFVLDSIYRLEPGDYHNASALPPGDIPLVSCGTLENGINCFVKVPSDRIYNHRLTIAFNGNTLTAKYHPYSFAAKDDVAVCMPRSALELSTEILIQVMLDRERWRYSYYRKCFIEKLRRFSIMLPAKHGTIDEKAAETILESNPYWAVLKKRLT